MANPDRHIGYTPDLEDVRGRMRIFELTIPLEVPKEKLSDLSERVIIAAGEGAPIGSVMVGRNPTEDDPGRVILSSLVANPLAAESVASLSAIEIEAREELVQAHFKGELPQFPSST